MNSNVSNYELSNADLVLLRKANLHTITDILLASVQDVAKKCKTSPIQVKQIFDKVLDSVPLLEFDAVDTLPDDEIFTTGDPSLDTALGGGIRTCMIWDLAGESAAGKTQLAMQLSLYVQAPPNHGGLSGGACYLTTSSTLPTARLLQIAETNDLLSIGCGLENVHTISVPTVPVLLRVLTDTLPTFIQQQHPSVNNQKPIKLLVVDALGELFHSNNKTTTSTLVERSQDVARISVHLHDLASKYRLAVLVLNEVIDVFKRSSSDAHEPQGDMLYDQQSRWFNTAEFFGDGSKESVLGLTWANQVNTRIMLSRTGRRKYLTADDIPKRRHLSVPEAPPHAKAEPESEPSLIRRLSVLFSNVASPVSLDYIVTECGISVVQGDSIVRTAHTHGRQPTPDSNVPNDSKSDSKKSAALVEGDEFDQLWDQEEYRNLDWDALELSLSQNVP